MRVYVYRDTWIICIYVCVCGVMMVYLVCVESFIEYWGAHTGSLSVRIVTFTHMYMHAPTHRRLKACGRYEREKGREEMAVCALSVQFLKLSVLRTVIFQRI